ESHYIGPLHGNNSPIYAGGPTGTSLWVNGMPHDAWRDIAQVYISAFKAGASTPTVTVQMPPFLTCKFNLLQTDKLVYYYHPTPKSAACSDNIALQPNRFQDNADSVFIIAMRKSTGTVTIISGSTCMPRTFQLATGMNTIVAPMGLGVQSFALSSTANLSGTGGLQITNQCTVYNFNVYVG
ncbi:glycoside hydrolase, partial [Mycena olivaceomarginata]